MGIVLRFKRLISADLHSILDSIEEPQEVLKQSIREMEEALLRRELTAAAYAQRQAAIGDLLSRYGEELGDLERQLKLCIEKGNDDLAKAVLRRVIVRQKEIKAVRAEAQSLQDRREILEKRSTEDRKRLEALKEKMALFKFESGDAGCGDISRTAPLGVSEEEIELALLQAKQAHAAEFGKAAVKL